MAIMLLYHKTGTIGTYLFLTTHRKNRPPGINQLVGIMIIKRTEGLVDIASVRISNDDPLLAFLEQMGVSYIDNRPKAGRLWIIGNRSLKDTTAWLKSRGYSFVYCNSGSKSTNWESAWFLDDTRIRDTGIKTAGISPRRPFMVRSTGFEPVIFGLSIRCSTI